MNELPILEILGLTCAACTLYVCGMGLAERVRRRRMQHAHKEPDICLHGLKYSCVYSEFPNREATVCFSCQEYINSHKPSWVFNTLLFPLALIYHVLYLVLVKGNIEVYKLIASGGGHVLDEPNRS